MVHLSAVSLTFVLSLNKPNNIVCAATEPRNVWSASCYAFIPTGSHGLVAGTVVFLFKRSWIQILDKKQTILRLFVVFFGPSRKNIAKVPQITSRTLPDSFQCHYIKLLITYFSPVCY